MTLRWNKILLLIVVLGGLNLALYLLSQQVYLKSFTVLEHQVAHDNLSRAFQALYHDVDNLKLLATDRAEWDDTYRFMANRNPDYLDSNFSGDTLQNLELNFFLLLSAAGEPVVSLQNDLTNVGSNPLEAELGAFLQEQMLPLLKENERESYAGLQHFQKRLMLLAINPVLTSEGNGPARGVMVMGRFVDPNYLAELSFRTRNQLGLEIWSEEKVLERLNREMDSGQAGWDSRLYFVTDYDHDQAHLYGYILLQDFDGHFGPVLTLQMPRKIYQQGQQTVRSFLFWAFLFSLLAACLVYFIMDRLARTIRQRRESEQKYQRLSFEFQAILDGIPDELTLVSPEGKVVWANSASVLSAGLLPRDRQGRYRLTEEESSDRSEVILNALREGAICEQTETDEEGRRHLNVKAIPLLDADGRVSGVIKLVSDQTEETRLREENEQSARLAALGEIAAGVAHEINNPNGMIQVNLGLITDVWHDLVPLLRRQAEKDPDLQFGGLGVDRVLDELPVLLQEMSRNTRRVSTIVEDLKGFAGRDVAEGFTEIDLNVVATAAERMVSHQIYQAGAEYKKTTASGLPAVGGHFMKLEQVVVNLLMNACQAVTEPGAKLTLRTWYDVAQKEVVLVVEDSGCGIAAADLGRITNPFFTTRRESGGTGLGLSVSSRIVKEHGGRLLFRSEAGAGTVVELRLPCHKEES